MDRRWEVLDVEDVYEHEYTKVSVAKVELPDKTVIDHHFVSVPRHPKGFAVLLANVAARGVLMLWRHRFITDQWTWELPGGGIENESAAAAAGREFTEETGWRPGKIEPLIEFQPLNGVIDYGAHCFITREATWVGPGRDENESSDVAWMSIADIRSAIRRGEVSDGPSLGAITYAMAFDLLR